MAAIDLESYQRGQRVITDTDGTVIDIPIATVDPTRAFVTANCRSPGTSPRMLRTAFTGSVLNATTARFIRNDASFAPVVTMEWSVGEWAPGVLNNLIKIRQVRTSAVTTIPLAPAVDPSKSIPLMGYECSEIDINGRNQVYGEIIQTTVPGDTLRLTSNSVPSGDQSTVGVQLLEFASDAEITVTPYVISLPSGDTLATTTISAVTVGKTGVIHGGYTADYFVSEFGIVRMRCAHVLTGATTLETRRQHSLGGDITTVAYVVELSGANHAVTLTAANIVNGSNVAVPQPTWAALTPGKTMIISGWTNDHYEGSVNGIDAEDNLITHFLSAGADGATVTRESTTGDSVLHLYAWDFSPSGAAPLIGRFAVTVNASVVLGAVLGIPPALITRSAETANLSTVLRAVLGPTFLTGRFAETTNVSALFHAIGALTAALPATEQASVLFRAALSGISLTQSAMVEEQASVTFRSVLTDVMLAGSFPETASVSDILRAVLTDTRLESVLAESAQLTALFRAVLTDTRLFGHITETEQLAVAMIGILCTGVALRATSQASTSFGAVTGAPPLAGYMPTYRPRRR